MVWVIKIVILVLCITSRMLLASDTLHISTKNGKMTLSIWPDGQRDRNFPFSYTYAFFIKNNDPIKRNNFGTFVYKNEDDLIFAKYRGKKLTFSELKALKKRRFRRIRVVLKTKRNGKELILRLR